MSPDTEKFYRIIGGLDRHLTPGAGERFWAARSLFAEMDRSFVNGWSLCRLNEILNDSQFLVFRDRNALTINVAKGYAISLAMIDSVPASLYLFPQHYMARNIGRAPLKVRRYAPDRPIANDVYNPAVRLLLQGEVELAPGQSLERNGYADVLDWECDGPAGFVLRLHSELLGSYEWAFDRQTLSPKGVTVVDSFSSQVTTAMQMLRALGTPVDKGFIEEGLASPYFHVRWETLKMISHIAPELAPEAIERLRNDPHPAIRRAAEKTAQMNASSQANT